MIHVSICALMNKFRFISKLVKTSMLMESKCFLDPDPDFRDTLSPYIEVETCGLKKSSTSKSEVVCKSNAVQAWREHLFFEPRNMVSTRLFSVN